MDHLLSPSDAPDSISPLRVYTRAKFEVAALLRDARRITQPRAERAQEAWRTLLARLAEDRFNLAVVGQFKRGKSTLLNALIGRELLPTGLLPLTSAITSLRYGSAPCVRLRRAGWSIEEEVPLAKLADYVTERGNPGNEKGLIEARVELPVPLLRRGLHFIDTPGIGSTQSHNTATTYSFLPQMDAVIFVTSGEAPLSEMEAQFLTDIREHVRRLFLVVNKMDMLSRHEGEEVLAYIRAQVLRELECDDIDLYPLSARDGLGAKLRNDAEAFVQSGLLAFEQALTSFLAREQERTFLVSVLDQALHLFSAADTMPGMAPGMPPDAMVSATPGAGPTPVDSSEMEGLTSAGAIHQGMEALRARLLHAAPTIETDGGEAAGQAPNASVPAVIDQAVAAAAAAATRPGRPSQSSPGRSQSHTCPICSVQAEALFAFFAKWQQALATSAEVQRAFATAGGFCPAHTWQLQGMASPLGISEGYAPLIETLAAALAQGLTNSVEQTLAHVTRLHTDVEVCAACRLLRETARAQAATLLEHVMTAEGRERYMRQPASLCLPHLRAVLGQLQTRLRPRGESDIDVNDRAVVGLLLREQIRRLEELGEDLQSYVLKRHALRRGLTTHEEETAWRRALVQLVGERVVNAPAAVSPDQG